MFLLCNMNYNTTKAEVFCSLGPLLLHELSEGMWVQEIDVVV